MSLYFLIDDNDETWSKHYSQTNKNGASHNAHLSHLISSGKQHNYTLYINYHELTRNIKNNILLQDIYRVSEKT